MWTYHPDLLAKPVPRYTSYPTAAEFTDTVGSLDMATALDQVGADEDVSLYLHIPYCRQICWYCGCNTGAATREGRLAAYVERLHEEIALIAARLNGRGRVRRIALGGGSPNAIGAGSFLRLVDSVVAAFHCDSPLLSVELDPRGFDEDWAAMLQRAEVKRVSLGIQTLDPAVQAAIGRIQPLGDIRRSVQLLRQAGVESINFDLMYGLPGQDEAILKSTLGAALELGPDRLAVFGYAHVPHLVPRQRRIDEGTLPNPMQRFDQARLAHDFLVDAGLQAVGFDHFARPGDPMALAAREGRLRRNFQGFTDDDAPHLIGIGASAISAFPDRLLQNEKNSGRWHLSIASERFATHRGIRRDADDRARGAAIESLLTRGAADLAPLLRSERLRARLMPFEARALLSWQGTRVVLSPGALPYARTVAATFDRYRCDGAGSFSHAV